MPTHGRRRATTGAIESVFLTSSPARLGAGEELKEGACAKEPEFTRQVSANNLGRALIVVSAQHFGVGCGIIGIPFH